MTISEDFINHMTNNGIMDKGMFSEYYINNSIYLELYNYLIKLINLDERIDLDEKLQNSLLEIDKRHLPQIIIIKKTLIIMKSFDNVNLHNDFKKLEDNYKLKIEKFYDKLFIENAKIKIEEQNKTISLLLEEINEMKSNRKVI
jgi:hypothetical protein